MKRTKQCPKCQSLRVGHIAAQPQVGKLHQLEDGRTVGLGRELAGQPVGLGPVLDTGAFFGVGEVRPLVGKLEAYVCGDCGFHETYVAEPRSVPWTTIEGFSWVNPDVPETGPFR